ncbi:hypothetical protein [Paenibacillus polymyxa]|uniref:hypothetical protein n=1 Tax=Paenibacillus polymyxa TaxID=1406 RepID=UPI0021E3A9D1|nr:hypothetical protein [Paenibacillus polymyxa]
MKLFKNIKFSTIIMAVIALYSIFFILLLNVDDWGKSGTLGDSFGILNTLFSGIALAGVVYTLNLQAQATELQRKDYARSIQPLLAIESIQKNEDQFKLCIINIGNGTALNIDFLPSVISSDRGIEFRANRIISLTSGEKKEFEVKTYQGNMLLDNSWTAHLDPNYANRAIRVILKFNDIEFNEMKQAFELGLGDNKVTMISTLKKH